MISQEDWLREFRFAEGGVVDLRSGTDRGTSLERFPRQLSCDAAHAEEFLISVFDDLGKRLYPDAQEELDATNAQMDKLYDALAELRQTVGVNKPSKQVKDAWNEFIDTNDMNSELKLK